MRKWVRRIAYLILTLLVLALLGGFTYEQVGRARDASQLPPRVGQAVDIGGRSLNLYCSGQGTPTVILEPGGNSPGYSWLVLQAKMAAFTRACWYDRAGVGWSDPPTSPRTSASIASDLHEALHRAGVLPPYVMAGGSVGGEYVHIYTAHYPTDVAGLVLIDSATPDMHEPDFALAPINRMSGSTRHLICMALPAAARFGIIRFLPIRSGAPLRPISPLRKPACWRSWNSNRRRSSRMRSKVARQRTRAESFREKEEEIPRSTTLPGTQGA